ncbi:hypothetical protein HYH03_008786 [Edaphochlamys debaryana]|uniref:Uncharacterized protein n=1 Tax=Edaphochlamys debaryana TaxID=47281 RepID=A0A835XZ35_9CHLO|nr:hypothetical protein HYH03_008786 [Edaphochlamys debaryana]|eukprot:KAG2492871.1 hypothetical protein HYH03_008786 [Edaphochlamys debaryana]
MPALGVARRPWPDRNETAVQDGSARPFRRALPASCGQCCGRRQRLTPAHAIALARSERWDADGRRALLRPRRAASEGGGAPAWGGRGPARAGPWQGAHPAVAARPLAAWVRRRAEPSGAVRRPSAGLGFTGSGSSRPRHPRAFLPDAA